MEISLTKPQTEMFELTNKYPLFVAGYGSGKTQSMIVNALRDCLQFPGARIGAYCPTFDLLKLNMIPRTEEILLGSGITYKLNKQDHIFKLENGSEIIMRSMDNPARIIAYEVFRSHVDEIDTIKKDKANEIWLKVIARNRQAIMKKEKGELLRDEDGNAIFERNQISAYTTPDHGIHGFTYSKWGIAEKEIESAKRQGIEPPEWATDYIYVNAPTESNPHNPPEYVEALRKNYPAQLAEAFVGGKWVDMKGVGVFDTRCFMRWKTLPKDIEFLRIYGDTAQKTNEANDYTVFQLWGYSPSQGCVLIDQVRGKWESHIMRQKLIDFWGRYKHGVPGLDAYLDLVKVEDKSSGTGLIQEVAATTNMPIEGIPRGRDKFSRALDIVPQISMGNVWIPYEASWVSEYVEEFDEFTVEMKGHDDQIDPTIDAVTDMVGGRNTIELW